MYKGTSLKSSWRMILRSWFRLFLSLSNWSLQKTRCLHNSLKSVICSCFELIQNCSCSAGFAFHLQSVFSRRSGLKPGNVGSYYVLKLTTASFHSSHIATANKGRQKIVPTLSLTQWLPLLRYFHFKLLNLSALLVQNLSTMRSL